LVTRTLRSKGWRVLRIWEHQLSRRRKTSCLRRLLRVITENPHVGYDQAHVHTHRRG
jgi:G:T-mismatch repair DNA endonuclease (very short patch repair protein)